jgi:penicillin-binding protein 1A
MTGGTLPATLWHNIMTYAHQGIELRQLPGMPVPSHSRAVADASLNGSGEAHPILLTRKGTDALVHVERMLDEANRALAVQAGPTGTLGALGGTKDQAGKNRGDTLAAATGREAAGSSRGD